jgi:transposase
MMPDSGTWRPPEAKQRQTHGDTRETPWAALPAIPESTALAALATLASDDPYLTVGDHLELVLTGLEPARDDDGEWTWPPRALITVFQFIERFSDVEVLRAVRTRIDWKYALRLPLDYGGLPTFDLAPFRTGLTASGGLQESFGYLLRRITALSTPWSKELPQAPETVLAAIRNLNRMPLVYRTLARAVEALAGNDPDWYRSALPAEWLHHYPAWRSAEPLCHDLTDLESRIKAIGAAGYLLLERLAREDTPAVFSRLPEVELLRRVWWWQYDKRDGEVTVRSE